MVSEGARGRLLALAAALDAGAVQGGDLRRLSRLLGEMASGVPCLVRVPGHLLGAVAYACAFWDSAAGWRWLGWALSARLDANLVRDWMPGPGRESRDAASGQLHGRHWAGSHGRRHGSWRVCSRCPPRAWAEHLRARLGRWHGMWGIGSSLMGAWRPPAHHADLAQVQPHPHNIGSHRGPPGSLIMTITDPSRALTPTQGPSTTPLPTLPRRLGHLPRSERREVASAPADER